VPEQPSTTIVIPTRGRAAYLEVTLASVALAHVHGATYFSLPEPAGLNAARNAAVARVTGELIVFVDDDIEAPPGWLSALLAGVSAAPEHEVFGGPIQARLEGGGPRACGRESAPITTLDLGDEDRDVALVWGANMAIRPSAFARAGNFDETIFVRGDEEEWQRRLTASGGAIRYVAAAGLEHRRTASDSTVRSLSRAAFGHGRAARRFDARKGTAPSLRGEVRTLLGCAWHAVRRRCAFGIVFGAHTAGRLREALASRRP
jgi:GT2 family glycosyltransferase